MGRKRKLEVPEFYVHNAKTSALATYSSKDGRRVLSQRHEVVIDTRLNTVDHDREGTDDPVTALSPTLPTLETRLNQPSLDDAMPEPSDYEDIDTPLKAWIPFREEYTDELLRLEGRGFAVSRLSGTDVCRCPCGKASAQYRCRECFFGQMLCQTCLVTRHQGMPLHRVQAWNGHFFESSALGSLGLTIQLGHIPGRSCPCRQAGASDFTLIHTNGLHKVNISFCHCQEPITPHRVQLLRSGFWPATVCDPQTCASLEVLRHFHILNLQSKANIYDFYNTLLLETDGSGPTKFVNRLPQLTLMVRQYRHIIMGKRAGKGCDDEPYAQTPPGSFAVACRACPIPGVNIPADWQLLPDSVRWLHTLILAHDANFRLKNRMKSSEERDPMLGPGFAYFVDPVAFADHLKGVVDLAEISTCVGFQALLNMMTKKSKGLRVTGLAAVSCARHELFRPLGLVNLQKGERYVNMDYAFLSSASATPPVPIVISYDIACQWHAKFWERMKTFPINMQLKISRDLLRFKVPTFHLGAHNEICQAPFSLSLTLGVGHVDGEGVERNWSTLNAAGPSTKEMGPGSRQDTLDDFVGFANWKKVIGYGQTLYNKMVEAVLNFIKLSWVFRGFDDHIREKHEGLVAEWEEMIHKWYEDMLINPSNTKASNPFSVPENDLTIAEVRKRLAEEEHIRVTQGKDVLHEVGLSSFIAMGLEIQDSQRAILLDYPDVRTLTKYETLGRDQKRNTLRKKLDRFLEVQSIHMPALHRTTPAPTQHESVPEKTCLSLPSDIPATERKNICTNILIKAETDLREASAIDSIFELRHHLRTRTFVNRWKIKNITGQRPNTRAREVQRALEVSISSAKFRYRADRLALMQLKGPGSWETSLKPLLDSDVRALNERELTIEEAAQVDNARRLGNLAPEEVQTAAEVIGIVDTGEARRTLSWIWYSIGGSEALDADTVKDPTFNAAVRCEWAKAKARADRWREELLLVEEEMRRVLTYCEYAAKLWTTRSSQRKELLPDLAEGIHAYCSEHVHLEQTLAAGFMEKWAVVRRVAKEAIIRVDQGDESITDENSLIEVLTAELGPIQDW